MKYVIIILIVALVGAGYVYRDDISASLTSSEKPKEKDKKNKDKNENKEAVSPEIKVIQQWQLPDRLKEISGLSYIDSSRFACVQDEEGVMFIYNIKDQKVEKEVSFGNAGDYEGISVVDNTAYIVRSDGVLFEITNWNGKHSVKQYKTGLSAEHNVEGLVYDKGSNRLLIGIKDDEPNTKDYKGIYSFDLTTKQFLSNPVFKIDMNSSQFESGKKKKSFKPSALAIHPSSNDLFIVDGAASRLMVMDGKGGIKQLFNLGDSFEQPEGITFSPNGDIFISSEGVKKASNITQIEIK